MLPYDTEGAKGNYKMQKNNKSTKVQNVCNVCGRKLLLFSGETREDALQIEKDWGFFSNKDRQKHRFALCEQCYDQWIATFSVPVEQSEVNELL